MVADMKKTSALSLALAGASFSFAGNALAIPCNAINGNPVVYVAGTVKPYVTAVARALFNDAQPITVIYKGITSCLGIDAIVNSTPISGTGFYYDPSSTATNNEQTCDLPTPEAGLQLADIGSSDVFAPTCASYPNGFPADVRDGFGPIQAMGFVVNSASSQHAISASAAYLLFGQGADVAGIKPWIDPAHVFKRNEASGTSLLIGADINLAARKWKNTDPMFSGQMITDLTSAGADAEKTLGVLAKTDIVGALESQLRMLAFKDYNQSCAYYPDAGETSKDKQNVRDGHYSIWGPTHFYVRTVSGAVPDTHVARVYGILTGTSNPPAGLDLIQVAQANNLVPTCAMKVQRTSEGGPITPFSPTQACGCRYDQLANGKNSCQTCNGDGQCGGATPKCNYGFCEKN